MLPAHQGLEADHPQLTAQRHLGLVVHPQLGTLHGVVEGRLQLQALQSPGARDLIEELVARAAQLLGAVHRRVGLADHRLRRRAGIDDRGHADTHRDLGLAVLEGNRPRGRPRDPVGDQDHLPIAAEVLEQQRELVAAKAGDRVHRSQHSAQPPGQTGEHGVADAMTEGVVDVLELVDIHEQHGDHRAGAPSAIQRHPEPVQEQRPVGQSGERVAQRQLGQLHLRALALDRVADRAAQERRIQVLLDQAILGAGVQRLQRQLLVDALAEHDDRGGGGGGAQRLNLLRRAGPSELQGEQHAGGAVIDQLLCRTVYLQRLDEHEALAPDRVQHLADHQHRLWIVLDQQDPRGLTCCGRILHQGVPRLRRR